MRNPPPYLRSLWLSVTSVYILACAIFDLLPLHGPPRFRYMGSDLAKAVWNIGWPLPTCIFDPHTGMHQSPMALPQLTLQLLALAMFVTIIYFCRPRRRRPDPAATEAFQSLR